MYWFVLSVVNLPRKHCMSITFVQKCLYEDHNALHEYAQIHIYTAKCINICLLLSTNYYYSCLSNMSNVSKNHYQCSTQHTHAVYKYMFITIKKTNSLLHTDPYASLRNQLYTRLRYT